MKCSAPCSEKELLWEATSVMVPSFCKEPIYFFGGSI
jgi:hypothetical protein